MEVTNPRREAAAADRLEIVAGDLVRRLTVLHRATPLEAELVEAVAKVRGAINEREAAVAPFGDQRLLEAQGKRIRALEAAAKADAARLAEACQRIADLADDRSRLERELAAEGRGTRGELSDALAKEGLADLAAWKASCARCGRPTFEHVRGACPKGENGRAP